MLTSNGCVWKSEKIYIIKLKTFLIALNNSNTATYLFFRFFPRKPKMVRRKMGVLKRRNCRPLIPNKQPKMLRPSRRILFAENCLKALEGKNLKSKHKMRYVVFSQLCTYFAFHVITFLYSVLHNVFSICIG